MGTRPLTPNFSEMGTRPLTPNFSEMGTRPLTRICSSHLTKISPDLGNLGPLTWISSY
jgi:hypothetical protein